MRIAAFYENIRTGAVHDGISMVEAVSDLRRAGLGGIYVSYESTLDYAGELAEVLEKTGAELTGLHGWIAFNQGKEAARPMIDQAVRLGTGHVLIVPVCNGNVVETLMAGIQDAVLYGEKTGVKVYMEDLDQPDSPYNSVAGLRIFLDRIPGLSCCFDTGNLIMHGEDELQAFQILRGRITALHLKDRSRLPQNPADIGKRTLDGGIRYPIPVGQGEMKIREILALAGDMPAIVELYDYSPAHMLAGIRASVEWVRKAQNRDDRTGENRVC